MTIQYFILFLNYKSIVTFKAFLHYPAIGDKFNINSTLFLNLQMELFKTHTSNM